MDTHLDVDALPNDAPILKHLLRDTLKELQETHERLGEVTHLLRQLQRWRFGRRSEKVPEQQMLFAFVQAFSVPERVAPQVESAPKPPRKSKAHGRRVVPKDLPKVQVIEDLPEDQKKCRRCRKELVRIGQEVSTQLDVKPPELLVRETIRPKYACRCEGHGVAIAELPEQPIPRCLAAPGLLSWIAVQKYQFHLPLYRQSKIFASQGVDLSPSTLGDWIAQTAKLLEPVHTAMKKDVLESEILNTDDSPMPVLDPELDRTRQGRIWTYLGDASHRHVVYEYSPNHQHQWAKDFLGGYDRYLQADAWKGYDALFKRPSGPKEVACWAHCRRYWFEAKLTDAERALAALAFIHRLYEIEELARELEPEDRRAQRQAYALPILEAFKRWIASEALKILPRTPIAKAFAYTQGQWTALCRYVDDGRISIDNNASERALRGPVVGKKNWMFFGSDQGGRRAAILYSLIESAKINRHNPFFYLRDVISRISPHRMKRIIQLTPARWKPRDGPDTS